MFAVALVASIVAVDTGIFTARSVFAVVATLWYVVVVAVAVGSVSLLINKKR